jgi:hypothetical protein
MECSETAMATRRTPGLSGLVLFCSFLSAAFLLNAVPAQACDFCMLGQGISPYLTSGGKGLTLDVNYVESDHVYNGATSVNPNGLNESWTIYTLTGFYPLSEDLTAMISLPYVSKTNLDFDATTDSNPGTVTAGIGDVTLTGRYTLFEDHHLTSTLIGGLLGGIKLPTGSTDLRDVAGNPVDRHALPGTGSFDFNVGFTGSYTAADGFQLSAEAVYSITTTGKWAGRDHRYGNTLNFSTKAFYRLWSSQPSLKSFMPFLGISGDCEGKETGVQTDTAYLPNQTNLSTGGTEIFADVGMHAGLGSDTFVALTFSKAFYHHMNLDPGFEPDPAENYKIRTSITYLF